MGMELSLAKKCLDRSPAISLWSYVRLPSPVTKAGMCEDWQPCCQAATSQILVAVMYESAQSCLAYLMTVFRFFWRACHSTLPSAFWRAKVASLHLLFHQ